MIGANLKTDERILIQVIGDGPLGQIIAESDELGNARGYVHNPLVHFPLNSTGKLDVARAVGSGMLYVTRDMGLKEPYRGSVPLISSELAEDFAYYFVRSEQTPSAVSLGVLVDTDSSVKASGGMIIQLMPGASSDVAGSLAQRIVQMPAPTKMVDSGKSPREIFHMALGDMGLQILEETPAQFKCGCTRDRMETSLITLGPDELRDMIETQHGAELICHFCGEKRWFTETDLKRLLLQSRKSNDDGDGDVDDEIDEGEE